MRISKQIIDREMSIQLSKYQAENDYNMPARITVSLDKFKQFEIVLGTEPHEHYYEFDKIKIDLDEKQSEDYKLWKE